MEVEEEIHGGRGGTNVGADADVGGGGRLQCHSGHLSSRRAAPALHRQGNSPVPSSSPSLLPLLRNHMSIAIAFDLILS